MKAVNRESRYSPPESSLRFVKESLSAHTMLFSAETIELSELLFDSARQTLYGEVRGTAAVARQLLYRAGSVCIDMHVQPTPGSDSAVLVGQLLDSTRPAQGIKDIPVSLLCEGEAISNQRTNDVGEFNFGIESLHGLQLVFGIRNRGALIVALPNTADAGHSLA